MLEVSTAMLIVCTGSAHQEHALSREYGFLALGCARGKHGRAHCEHNHSRNEPFSTWGVLIVSTGVLTVSMPIPECL